MEHRQHLLREPNVHPDRLPGAKIRVRNTLDPAARLVAPASGLRHLPAHRVLYLPPAGVPRLQGQVRALLDGLLCWQGDPVRVQEKEVRQA